MLDLKALNPQQRIAATHTEGPLLVLAGAGSGKTKVITCRIAHLIENKGVLPENILAVTFTNKAAKEMQERLKELVGSRGKGMTVSTFHSLGVKILRQDIRKLGYKKNFSIYSTSDQLGLIRQALREENDSQKKIDPDSILWKISGAKNALLTPEEYRPQHGDELDLMAAAVYPRYQALLKSCNAIDFDDLIMLTVTLLRDFPDVLSCWQNQFRYILVDEYQDTNPSQYLLISMLAATGRNICVVGDDDQSIYGWRGADVEKILNFERDYPGCRVVMLEQNYRSTGTILDAANHVIRNNSKRKVKALWTESGPGRPIDLIVAADDEEEATTVVERIETACFRDNLNYGDCAILYRTNAQSRPFEEQLRFAGIPYILIGGMQFYERKEVKDSLAWLRAIANPEDEQSLLRIVNFPKRGIGEGTVLKINQWSMERGIPLFEALTRVDEIDGVTEALRAKVKGFHDLLQEEMEGFSRPGHLADKADRLFRRIGLEEELYRTIDEPATARRKVENIEQVINSLAGFENGSANATLSLFLEKVTLMDEDRFSGKDKKEHGRDAVTLMSLHSSKGLEFPLVWLVGLEEEILPHKKSIYEDFSIDEERRLMYVGITRARRHLTITRCLQRKQYGKMQERQPSRFLEEIPEQLVNLQQAAGAQALNEGEAEKMADDFFSRMKGMLG
ncbi:ATP-dependent DNA helicase PcrA [Geobacter sp. OR-1]|uniref:ATP-dependent helicase n=1 Tax=Geobacter sp. OR-1 TaxID=1266765 RepID=UPI0005443ECF|nr:UvrD-helicase domain-containing protein [Geobacter sp. OR-1]GAM08975.1 ATP-dependent DNA helicase PcrA [Geobacter sp. OR-1]